MLNEYRRILSQNLWHSDRTFLSAKVADWLMTTESLTVKLERHCVQLRVKVIDEYFTNQRDWRREVILSGDQQQWIFAQTDFSKELMQSYSQDILQLREMPLGHWLFKQHPKRISTEWIQDPVTHLYARCSVFEINHHRLQVKELFLAEFDFPDSRFNGMQQ